MLSESIIWFDLKLVGRKKRTKKPFLHFISESTRCGLRLSVVWLFTNSSNAFSTTTTFWTLKLLIQLFSSPFLIGYFFILFFILNWILSWFQLFSYWFWIEGSNLLSFDFYYSFFVAGFRSFLVERFLWVFVFLMLILLHHKPLILFSSLNGIIFYLFMFPTLLIEGVSVISRHM